QSGPRPKAQGPRKQDQAWRAAAVLLLLWPLALGLGPDSTQRRAKVRRGVIPEFFDERMPFERLLYDAPLDAFAAAVDDPQLAQAEARGFVDVVTDHEGNVGGGEGVEVELGSDWDR